MASPLPTDERSDTGPTPDGLGNTSAASREHPPTLHATRIGRFVILRELGAGGMGVVYAAYDEDLGRRVAVKLLFGSKAEGTRARQRLKREAQVLARLSHPNVVQVYEVGQHYGDVFIAMEMVQGTTLDAWAGKEARPWPEVIACYVQAARGLHAAHQAGIFHRDFKPANAILGDDGRVRVLDFGLARAVEEPGPVPADAELPALTTEIQERLTKAGAVLGTPAYMAPEQIFGRPADARTDVFSFCVALYQALHGRRPYQGATLHVLLYSILSGPPLPPKVRLPARIEQVIRRGLQPHPKDRPASMQELIDALDFDPRQRRRRWLQGGATVLMVTGAAVGGTMLGEAPTDPCQGYQAQLSGTWDDARKAELEAAFESSGSELADGMWPRVATKLDERAQALVDGMQVACVATRVDGTQSEARFDRRMACLDDRLRGMRALTEVLGRADRLTVANAEDAVQALPDVGACADPKLLDSALELPHDDAQAQEIAEVRERVAEGNALVAIGHYLEAKPIAELAGHWAAAIGYEPLRAEVGYFSGIVDTKLGAYRSAHATFLDVVDRAEASHHDEFAADAWLRLIFLDTELLGDATGAEQWMRRAEAARLRIGDDVDREIELMVQRATLALERGELQTAEHYIDQATRLGGDQHPNLEEARARLEALRGHPEAVEHMLEQRLASLQVLEPPGHPRIAQAHFDLGQALMVNNELEEAKEHLDQALVLMQRTYGDLPHPLAGKVEGALGTAALYGGDLEQAKAYMERAVATMNASVGPSHPNTGQMLANLAVLAFNGGQLEASAEYSQRALEIYERSYGPDHVEWGVTATNLGETLLHLGRPDEARPLIEQGGAVIRAHLGSTHSALALPLKLEGFAHLLEGNPEQAVDPLSRALVLSAEVEAQERAEITAALAIATRSRDPERARALARSLDPWPSDEASRSRRRALLGLLARYQAVIDELGLAGHERTTDTQKPDDGRASARHEE